MINENLPKVGDTVYVRDVDDYNASGFKKRKNTRGFLNFYRDTFDLLPETVEEFIALACDEPISPCSEPLTIRKFLKMCRVAYDAAGVTERYPSDASDLFVYCHGRGMSYDGDFNGFWDKDWDSPEVFDSFYWNRYHPEELQFGGMHIVIQNHPSGWTGWFGADGHPSDPKFAKQAILAYIALRRNGYPITCSRPEEFLKEARVVR